MSEKLIVLGIDAASPALIQRWTAEGKLPAIRSLMDRGLSGTVAGVEGLFIGSTWPTFYTGLNPARHGMHRIEQLRSGSYDFFQPLQLPDGIGGTPFWKLASDAGRRVAVLDVPLSRIEPDLNGIQTVEWGGHDAVFGFRSEPPGLGEEILSSVGAYPLPSNCNADRKTAADFDRFISGLETAAQRRADLTLGVMQREPYDLLVQVFTEAHCAGHQCWHLHDPANPAHDAEVRAEIGDPLERIYRAIDAAIGRTLGEAGDTRVLLFSAHGMSHFRGAHFLLPEILHRLGASERPRDARTSRSMKSFARRALRSAWRMLPGSARETLRPTRGLAGGSGSVRAIRADLPRSRCFPIPNGHPVSGIRLNLAGREPQGILQPGDEADSFCAELSERLLEIIDERTGRPLIRRVLRTRDLWDGPRLDSLPDLLVEWSDELPTGTTAHGNGREASVRATSPAIGTVEGTNRWGRTGEHVPTGFFVLAGTGMPAGHRDTPVALADLHPTICRLLGLTDPEVDGAPLPDLSAWTE